MHIGAALCKDVLVHWHWRLCCYFFTRGCHDDDERKW